MGVALLFVLPSFRIVAGFAFSLFLELVIAFSEDGAFDAFVVDLGDVVYVVYVFVVHSAVYVFGIWSFVHHEFVAS